jgi:hypothetical protein
MEYVFRPFFKVERLYIILRNKIGIYKSLYLKYENDLQMCCSDSKMDITGGFVGRSSAKLTLNSSQSGIVTSRPLLASLPHIVCLPTTINNLCIIFRAFIWPPGGNILPLEI